MLGDSGSKSEGEHLTLRGDTWAALFGASRSDCSEEVEVATLLISTVGAFAKFRWVRIAFGF